MPTLQPPASSHFFTSQRLRLHYLRCGNPLGPPLLLLHGGLDHAHSWDWTVQHLQRDWHIIAPDLRGHGDSQWSDGSYDMSEFVFDLAELIEQQQLAPVTLVGHSLGGNICLRFAGIYPDKVRKLVAIEGLGPSPKLIAREAQLDVAERMQKWLSLKRQLSIRRPRRYASLADACARMQAANPGLSSEHVQHLTQHGVRQHADGSYSWKFDNALRIILSSLDHLTREQIQTLWSRISCPTLLIYGSKSWASNPQEDGRAAHFKQARVDLVADAGHWVHHDQPQHFMQLLQDFL